MSIRFSCPKCNKAFSVKDDHSGKKAKCACGARLTVPLAGEPTKTPDADKVSAAGSDKYAPTGHERLVRSVVLLIIFGLCCGGFWLLGSWIKSWMRSETDKAVNAGVKALPDPSSGIGPRFGSRIDLEWWRVTDEIKSRLPVGGSNLRIPPEQSRQGKRYLIVNLMMPARLLVTEQTSGVWWVGTEAEDFVLETAERRYELVGSRILDLDTRDGGLSTVWKRDFYGGPPGSATGPPGTPQIERPLDDVRRKLFVSLLFIVDLNQLGNKCELVYRQEHRVTLDPESRRR